MKQPQQERREEEGGKEVPWRSRHPLAHSSLRSTGTWSLWGQCAGADGAAGWLGEDPLGFGVVAVVEDVVVQLFVLLPKNAPELIIIDTCYISIYIFR